MLNPFVFVAHKMEIIKTKLFFLKIILTIYSLEIHNILSECFTINESKLPFEIEQTKLSIMIHRNWV